MSGMWRKFLDEVTNNKRCKMMRELPPHFNHSIANDFFPIACVVR